MVQSKPMQHNMSSKEVGRSRFAGSLDDSTAYNHSKDFISCICSYIYFFSKIYRMKELKICAVFNQFQGKTQRFHWKWSDHSFSTVHNVIDWQWQGNGLPVFWIGKCTKWRFTAQQQRQKQNTECYSWLSLSLFLVFIFLPFVRDYQKSNFQSCWIFFLS